MPNETKNQNNDKQTITEDNSIIENNWERFGLALLRFFKANIPLIGLLVLVVVLSFVAPNFFTSNNLLNVLRQAAVNGLLALGVTVVIISGGIDLSLGSVLAFTGMMLALLITWGVPGWIAIGLTLVLGAIIGIINGGLVSIAKLPPFIATLAGMMVYRGLTLLVSGGRPVSRLNNDLLTAIGRERLFGLIPLPAIILIVMAGVFTIILSKTIFGKRVYAIGGNEKGAVLSGINVKRTLLWIYMIAGIMAALAGIVTVGRVNSAVPTAGQMFELRAIAAAVIGGTSLAGGKGRAFGTLIGALILAVILNGLNLMGVSSYLQEIITGLIIIFAVIADRKK